MERIFFCCGCAHYNTGLITLSDATWILGSVQKPCLSRRGSSLRKWLISLRFQAYTVWSTN